MNEIMEDGTVKLAPEGTKFHCGLPQDPEGIERFRQDFGPKMVFVLRPGEEKEIRLMPSERVLLWNDDEKILQWLHDNPQDWMGAQIVGDEQRCMEFSAIMGKVLDLRNFDAKSMEFLSKDQLPIRNALRNFRWVQTGVSLKRLKGLGKNCAAVIVLAGPSLNSQWDQLIRLRRELPKDTCFIVIGRTYRMAMLQSVVPNFVLECEQFDWDDKIFMFAPPPPSACILAAPLTAAPSVFHAWPAQKLVLLDHNTAKMYEPEGFKVGEDSIGGGNGVCHHTLNLAHYLGCNPIVYCGLDLGYPDGEKADTHADGTFAPWSPEILGVEHTHQTPKDAVGNDGKPLQSSHGYHNFATLMRVMIHKMKQGPDAPRIYTVSPRGHRIPGINYIPIEVIGEGDGLCSVKQLGSPDFAWVPLQQASTLGSTSSESSSASTEETKPQGSPGS